jgi:DNA invertase Pin-like site-specific DNA recombinase
MKVALYARVETRDKQNLDVQLRELRRYSASRGFEIAATVMDKASGSTDDRVGLKRILGLVREKEVDLDGVTVMKNKKIVTEKYYCSDLCLLGVKT